MPDVPDRDGDVRQPSGIACDSEHRGSVRAITAVLCRADVQVQAAPVPDVVGDRIATAVLLSSYMNDCVFTLNTYLKVRSPRLIVCGPSLPMSSPSGTVRIFGCAR